MYAFSDLIVFVVGAIMALAFEYVPRLEDRFDQLMPIGKALVIVGLNLVVGFVVGWGYCDGWISNIFPGIEIADLNCDNGMWIYVVIRNFAVGATSSKVTHGFFKKRG